MTRIAFVTNLCPHYRRPLFELLATRMDVDFYFHSNGSERYWSSALSAEPGQFRVIEERCIHVLGQPLLPGLAARLDRRRYDVVVKCLNGRLMVPFVYSVAKVRSLPFVLWTGMWDHPQTVAHRVTRPLTEHVYRGSDAIVAYGDHVRDHLLRVRGVGPERIFVAGQAVDNDRFARVAPAEPTETAVVLFVGQLEPRKGLQDLLLALRQLSEQVRLRIAGAGPLESVLRAAAENDGRIELVGHLSQRQLPDELARATCLVLPSVTTARDKEPWGLVVNEAMAAGLPVVATTAVGAAAGGLVRDGANGFVVPERDPVALRTALSRLVGDPALAGRLGHQAARDVRAFTYERMADAFEEAIEFALAGRSATCSGAAWGAS